MVYILPLSPQPPALTPGDKLLGFSCLFPEISYAFKQMHGLHPLPLYTKGCTPGALSFCHLESILSRPITLLGQGEAGSQRGADLGGANILRVRGGLKGVAPKCFLDSQALSLLSSSVHPLKILSLPPRSHFTSN